MSSTKGGGKPFNAFANESSSKGKSVSEVSSPAIDQLSKNVADMSLDSAQDGGWEVYARKQKNRGGSSAAKPWVLQNSNTKAWGHPDVQKLGMRSTGGAGKDPANAWPAPTADSRRAAGRGNTRQQTSNRGFDNFFAPAAVIPPPPENPWKRNGKYASTQSSNDGLAKQENISSPYSFDVEDDKGGQVDDDEDDIDDFDESDDELLSDDSDTSQKSHDTRKKSKWFKAFFEKLDTLSVEEINEPSRQWHCPACQAGPGAIDWYRGLQPLMTHAKTKGSTRVKPHRELAELLDEELRRKGTSVVPAGEAFGKWKGLNENVARDKEIVWPPMVVIMNTRLEKDENDKWIGMGNQELLDYFSSYAAVKARHSYGPQGHRGMSILIFETSAVGYLEAERLSKHFEDQRTDREAWDRHRVPFYPGGQRQLYGYMAESGDLDIFNQHSQGKSKLKFDMRSYREMVVSQMKQMSEDNQQLIWFKNKVVKEQKNSKALEESFGLVSEKLRKTLEENRIVRMRTKMHHEQNKEEMDCQEQFFKDQIQIIHNARDAKEDNFEKIQQEEREKVKQSFANPSSTEDYRCRAEEVAKFIKFQDKEIEVFVEEREKLIKLQDDKRIAMKRRHWEEEVELEKEFDTELTRLMEKYTPHQSEEGKGNSNSNSNSL